MHLTAPSLVAIDRNGWSRCVGTSGHDRRNAHLSGYHRATGRNKDLNCGWMSATRVDAFTDAEHRGSLETATAALYRGSRRRQVGDEPTRLEGVQPAQRGRERSGRVAARSNLFSGQLPEGEIGPMQEFEAVVRLTILMNVGEIAVWVDADELAGLDQRSDDRPVLTPPSEPVLTSSAPSWMLPRMGCTCCRGCASSDRIFKGGLRRKPRPRSVNTSVITAHNKFIIICSLQEGIPSPCRKDPFSAE